MSIEEIEYYNRIWYYNTYNNLINKSLHRGLDKTRLDYYTERHHILPKCMGGKDEESNYVLLTAKEHIIAHMLLQRCYPDNAKLACAVDYMFRVAEALGKNIKISVSTAAYYRELWHEKRKLIASNIGKNISKSTKGKKRGPMSKEGYEKWKKHIKYGVENRTFGTSASDEARKKQSLAKLGKSTGPRDEKFKTTISNRNSGHPQGKEIEGPDGTIYPTLASCARENNITVGILRNWINRHPEKGFKYTGKYTSVISCIRKIQGPDGTIYDSVKEAGQATNHSPVVIGRWAKNNEKGFSYID